MGALEMAVLVSALLIPTCSLTQERPDLTTRERVMTLNLKFDPRTMILSWDCKENASNVACSMIHKGKGPIKMTPREKNCHCKFLPLQLHDGVEFVVEMNTNQRPLVEKLLYPNSGGESTAARNFSCFIYNVRSMNCTWVRGRAAPRDVQYFFYVRDSEGEETGCPHYVKASGTHVGCHFDQLPALTLYNYFLVNGTSREMGVQFSDLFLSIQQIERINPPLNISVRCNTSHCLITWEKPRTYRRLSFRELDYQLDIRQEGSKSSNSELICVHGYLEDKYNFPSYDPRAKYTLQMRSQYSRRPNWGPWSDPITFGTEERESSPVYIYVLVVLGTLIFALTIGFLFKRFLVMQSLFPPIPGIKDKLNDNCPKGPKVTWEEIAPCAGKGGNEEILTIEEVAGETA